MLSEKEMEDIFMEAMKAEMKHGLIGAATRASKIAAHAIFERLAEGVVWWEDTALVTHDYEDAEDQFPCTRAFFSKRAGYVFFERHYYDDGEHIRVMMSRLPKGEHPDSSEQEIG